MQKEEDKTCLFSDNKLNKEHTIQRLLTLHAPPPQTHSQANTSTPEHHCPEQEIGNLPKISQSGCAMTTVGTSLDAISIHPLCNPRMAVHPDTDGCGCSKSG
jgi:hypothetical protein